MSDATLEYTWNQPTTDVTTDGLSIKDIMSRDVWLILVDFYRAYDQGMHRLVEFFQELKRELQGWTDGGEDSDDNWHDLILTQIFHLIMCFVTSRRYLVMDDLEIVNARLEEKQVESFHQSVVWPAIECIYLYARHLWLNAEGDNPDYTRGLPFTKEVELSPLDGTPQFERFRDVVEVLLEQLSTFWALTLKFEGEAPDQNFLNWIPGCFNTYEGIMMAHIRLHMLYL